ncbi:hypothetical protein [Flavobacterium sp.]|uniref:hypothetical protein n=1 Tax=Flavobacterium sp. TaxID=239 RepID=UPI0026351374|nr:hypothetical protein [Flavobacterium sp.]
MRENITVAEAISKGKVKLVYLPMVILFLSIGLGFYLQFIHYFEGWIIGVSVFAGFVLAWFAWSYFVVEWKIWAFENVRNVHELKRKAIQNNLIWKDDSWFKKTEIIRYDQKQKLKQLEKKFLEKDVYHDDLNVPKETLIHYSKAAIIFGLVLGGAFSGYAIYILLTTEKEYFYLLFLAVGVYFLYNSISKLINNSPQIVINSTGITLHKQSLMKWQNITNECVESRRSGKHMNYYLVLKFNNKNIEFQIDDLNIDGEKLESLMQVYRVRFGKNNQMQ